MLGIYPMVRTNRIAGGIVIAYHATTVGQPLPALQQNDDVDEAGWFRADDLPKELAFESTLELLNMWRNSGL
jgi:hypothetical protein